LNVMLFLKQLLSFLKPPTMDSLDLDLDSFDIFFDPNIILKSKLFLLLITNWASSTPNPEDSILRFKVQRITHYKLPNPPEHEFLVIETLDKLLGQTKQFILDRTASRQGGTTTPDASADPAPSADPSAVLTSRVVERLKKFVAAITTLFSARSEPLLTSMEKGSSLQLSSFLQLSPGSSITSDPLSMADTTLFSGRSEHLLTSMEEGLSLQLPPSLQLSPGSSITSDPLSMTDKVSLSLTETADLISDSLNISDISPAFDRFMGENHVNSPRWQGQKIQSMIIHDLTLFDLVILAHVIHELYPTYSILKEQCYFYAGLVYNSVRAQWDVSDCPTDPRQSGRYQGMKVEWVEGQEISNAISSYRSIRPQVLARVILFRSIKIPLTTAFNTGHGTVDCPSGPEQLAKSKGHC
jgi:hypothetical protein